MSKPSFSLRGLQRPHSPQRRPGNTHRKYIRLFRQMRLQRFQYTPRRVWANNMLWRRLENRPGLEMLIP